LPLTSSVAIGSQSKELGYRRFSVSAVLCSAELSKTMSVCHGEKKFYIRWLDLRRPSELIARWNLIYFTHTVAPLRRARVMAQTSHTRFVVQVDSSSDL